MNALPIDSIYDILSFINPIDAQVALSASFERRANKAARVITKAFRRWNALKDYSKRCVYINEYEFLVEFCLLASRKAPNKATREMVMAELREGDAPDVTFKRIIWAMPISDLEYIGW